MQEEETKKVILEEVLKNKIGKDNSKLSVLQKTKTSLLYHFGPYTIGKKPLIT